MTNWKACSGWAGHSIPARGWVLSEHPGIFPEKRWRVFLMYAFQPISGLQIFHNFSTLSNSWYLQNKTSWLPSSPDSQISYKSKQWVFIIQLWLLRLAGIWISPKSTLSPAPLLTLNLSHQHLNSATTEHLIELLFAIFEFPSISSPTCSYIELTLPAALQWQLHNKALSTRLKICLLGSASCSCYIIADNLQNCECF